MSGAAGPVATTAPAAATRPVAAPPNGLYVHVPFCVSHCPYCDFVVVAGREARGPANRIASFVDAARVELELRAAALDVSFGPPGARPPLETLYLGGGTPSLLPTMTIANLVDLVRRRYGLTPDAEITLEVNPGPDERGVATAQRDAGVTRLSIGAQSLGAADLRALGRRHQPDDVAATVLAGRRGGMPSISLDLLYDIPGQTLDGWARTLDAALELEPDHLSAYALTLDDPDAEGLTGPTGDHLPTRAGARRWREKAMLGQDGDRAAAMYELADRRLAVAGMDWYEISNWARPGHRSRHNLAYWQGGAWEAVGPGAHAFDGVRRRWNAARLDGYLAALLPANGIAPSLPPGVAAPPLDDRAREAETTLLALRTSAGAQGSAIDRPRLGPALRWGLESGLLERAGTDALVLTMAGRLLSNEVFARLV